MVRFYDDLLWPDIHSFVLLIVQQVCSFRETSIFAGASALFWSFLDALDYVLL